MTEALKLKNRPQARWISLFPLLTVMSALALWRFLPAPASLYEYMYPNCPPGFILHPSLLILYSRKTLVVLALSLAFVLMLPFVLRLTFQRQYGRWRAITVLLLMLSGGLITPLISRYLDISSITLESSATYNGITYHIARSEKGNWLDYLVYKCDPAELICTYFSAGSASLRENWFFPPQIRVTADNEAVGVFRDNTLRVVLDELPHAPALYPSVYIQPENAAQLRPLATLAANQVEMSDWSGDGQTLFVKNYPVFASQTEFRAYNLSLQRQPDFLPELIHTDKFSILGTNNRGVMVFGDYVNDIVYVVDVNRRRVISQIPLKPFQTIQLSLDGSRLALSLWRGDTQYIEVYDTATGERLAQWQIDSGWNVALSPDGQTIAVFGHGLDVRNALTGELIYSRDDLALGYGQFSPDGRLLMHMNLSSFERKISFLDATGQTVYSLSVHENTPVAFSPDGRLFAGVELNGMLALWDIRELKQVARFAYSMPSSIDFSPDGRLMAIGSAHRVALWGISGI